MPQQFIQKTGVDPDTGANYEPVDIMKAINPDTGKLFTGLQEASDVGGYAPVAAPKPTVVGVNNSVNEIDQGADDIEDERTLAQNEIDRLAAEAEATENENNEFGDVSNYGAEFETIQTQRANLGLISTAELAEINAAGEAAGAEFAPLIAQAKERARLGRAKNLVATGRRGGLQRARFVGEEVFPSELGPGGGTGADATLEFEGKGGKLQEMAGAFQRNIDALIIQKNRAINLAKAQARKALRSNKQQDFENTKDILAFARQMNKDIEDAKQQKIENEFKEEQEERAEKGEARLESAEQRQRISSTFDIVKNIPEGTTVNIEGFDFHGIAVPEAEKDFFTGSNLISLMGQLEVGTSEIIADPNTGREYEIYGTKDPATVQAFDDQGNLSVIDKFSGEVISKAEGVGKSKTRAASTTIVLKGQEKEAKQSITDNLNSARNTDTGKVSVESYLGQFSQYVIDGIGDVGQYRADFPASLYLTPEDAEVVNRELAAAEASFGALSEDEDDKAPTM